MLIRFLCAFLLLGNVSIASAIEPPSKTDEVQHSSALECERFAGYPDPKGGGSGITFEKIDPAVAIPACEAATRDDPTSARLILNLGRAKLAAKDYKTSLELYTRAAEMGDTLAMALIGEIYAQGEGVLKDDFRAVEWFRKSAELGNAVAMGALASTYLYGRGNPQDYELALTWFQRAADLGDARSMAEMGHMYLSGRGVPKDCVKALRLITKGAELGNTTAMANLGAIYYRGECVDKSPEKGIYWWRKAADLGSKEATFRIGSEYIIGDNLPKDYSTALIWLRKAAELGDARAMNLIATMYKNALGVTQDYAQALFGFEKASELGQDPIEVAKLLGLKAEYRGITKDADRATDSVIKSLKMHNGYTRLTLMKFGWYIWTDDFHTLLQKKLKDQGFYAGEIDGNWSPALEIAIEKLIGDYHPPVAPG